MRHRRAAGRRLRRGSRSRCASGQPATVSATSTATLPSSIDTLRTMPRSTIERCSSGSSTGRKRLEDLLVGGHLGGSGTRRICTTQIGRIPAWTRRPPPLPAARLSLPGSSPPSSPRSPVRSVIRHDARSTCSPTSTTRGVTAAHGRGAIRAAPERGAPSPRQARRGRLPRRGSSSAVSTAGPGGRRSTTERRPPRCRSTFPSAPTTSCSPFSVARSRCCRPTRPSRWPRKSASSTAARWRWRWRVRAGRGRLRRAPRGRRRAHGPRLRRPRGAKGRNELTIVVEPLPVRRRRRSNTR